MTNDQLIVKKAFRDWAFKSLVKKHKICYQNIVDIIGGEQDRPQSSRQKLVPLLEIQKFRIGCDDVSLGKILYQNKGRRLKNMTHTIHRPCNFSPSSEIVDAKNIDSKKASRISLLKLTKSHEVGGVELSWSWKSHDNSSP